MDAIPAQPVQEILNQQVPAQPEATVTSNSVQEPQQKKINFRKFITIVSWIFLIVFLPITVLIFLSQNSLPGESFYPVKRGLENVILAVASVNPATKAAFRTDLTETRFKEAQILVVSKSNAGGLLAFADEIQATQIEVTILKNDTERKNAEERLLAKVDQYQSDLSNLQTKTEQNLVTYRFQEIPTSFPPPAKSDSVSVGGSPTTPPNQDQISPNFPSPTPTPVPTSTPILTSIPTVVPTIPVQQESAQVTEQKKIVETLKNTRGKLDKIKKDLEEKREENKNENENQNKNNSNKKTD